MGISIVGWIQVVTDDLTRVTMGATLVMHARANRASVEKTNASEAAHECSPAQAACRETRETDAGEQSELMH